MEKLIDQRIVLEKKIQRIQGELVELGDDGKGNLVDKEGFPRSDIDVYTVRHKRSELTLLRNDYKSLMDKIENELPNALSKGIKLSSRPFAVFELVDYNSPAFTAGITIGDLILKMDNCTSIDEVPSTLANAGSEIKFKVLRGESILELTCDYTSRRLGAKIVPYRASQ